MSTTKSTKKVKPLPAVKMKKYKPYPTSKLCDPNVPYAATEVWGTLDGQLIPIVNMRDSHLENVRGHLIKSGREYFLKYIDAEIERRKKLKLTKKSKAGKILYGRKKDSV